MLILLNKGGEENLTSAHGGFVFLTLTDKGGGGSEVPKPADIICELSLSQASLSEESRL